jgi:hypothetical protein
MVPLEVKAEKISYLWTSDSLYPCYVGPCHHSMARPQVAGGGMPPAMKGSCEHIE